MGAHELNRVIPKKRTTVQKREPIYLFSSIVLLTLLCISSMAEPRSWIADAYVQSPSSSLMVNRILFGGDAGSSVEDYATNSDMLLNHIGGASKIPIIHALNPNVTCLLYRNARAVYTGAAEYNIF